MSMKVDSELYYQHLRLGKRIGVKIFNDTNHSCNLENDIFGLNFQKNSFVTYCDPRIPPRKVGGVVFEKASKWKASESCTVMSWEDMSLALRVASNPRASKLSKSKKLTAKIIVFDPSELTDKVKRGMKMVSESPVASHGQKSAKWSFQKEEKREILVEVTCSCRHCSSEQASPGEVLQLKASVLKQVYADGGKVLSDGFARSDPSESVQDMLKHINSFAVENSGKGATHYVEGPVSTNNALAAQLMWMWAVEGDIDLSKYAWVVPVRKALKDDDALQSYLAELSNTREKLVNRIIPSTLFVFVNFKPSDAGLKVMLDLKDLEGADKIVLTTHEDPAAVLENNYELAAAPQIYVTSTVVPIDETRNVAEIAQDVTHWVESNVNLNLPEYLDLKSSGENVGNPDDLFPFELCLEYLAFQTIKWQVLQFFDPVNRIDEPAKPVDNLETMYEIAARHKLLSRGVDGHYYYDDERLQVFLAARYAGRMCYKLVLKTKNVEHEQMQMFYKFYAEFLDQFRRKYWDIVKRYSPISNLSDVPSRATLFTVLVQTATVLKLRVENRVFGIDFTGTYLYGQKKWFLKSARDSLDRGYDSNISEATISYALDHL